VTVGTIDTEGVNDKMGFQIDGTETDEIMKIQYRLIQRVIVTDGQQTESDSDRKARDKGG
jgi:hypothetical protein